LLQNVVQDWLLIQVHLRQELGSAELSDELVQLAIQTLILLQFLLQESLRVFDLRCDEGFKRLTFSTVQQW